MIADVAGESFPASLLMAISRTIIQSEAKNQEPSYLIRYLNNLISVDIGSEPEIFITILYGELNTKNKCFNYVNAAHTPPLIFRKESETLSELASGDKSLGHMGNIELENHEMEIESGDILLFYTDGVIKALDNQYSSGMDVLREILRDNHELSSNQLVQVIKNKILSSETNIDDVVLFVLKVD